jgi:hypothetical protein
MPTAGKITPFANQLIAAEWKLAKQGLYNVARCPTPKLWSVRSKNDTVDSVIPRFHHERMVGLDGNGYMVCDCEHYARCGYPCRHMACVLLHEQPDSGGFTHHDVDVHWWTTYEHYALRNVSFDKTFGKYLNLLLRKQTPGPLYPPCLAGKEWVPTEGYTQLPRSAKYRCKNYTRRAINRALRVHAAKHHGLLTQESNCNDSSSRSNLDDDSDMDDDDDDDDDHINEEEQYSRIFGEALRKSQQLSAPVHPSTENYIRDVREEVTEFISLLRAGNCPNVWEDTATDIKSFLMEANVQIKRKMRQAAGIGDSASYNPQRAKQKRRTYASKNCL